jgi:hypothetical protein
VALVDRGEDEVAENVAQVDQRPIFALGRHFDQLVERDPPARQLDMRAAGKRDRLQIRAGELDGILGADAGS